MPKRKLRGTSSGMRMEMKRRILVIHEDQDRNQRRMGNQRRTNTVSKKGNTKGDMEMGKRRGRGQGKDKDKVRTRTKTR